MAAVAGPALPIRGRYRGPMTVRHRRVMQVAAGGGVTWRSDDVSTEEPLEIRVGDVSLSVTMRTPGDDFDLVAGFLITEGIVRDASHSDHSYQGHRCSWRSPSECERAGEVRCGQRHGYNCSGWHVHTQHSG